LTYYQIALLLCLGSVTGLVAGLLGIGGGMIMVPFLTLLLQSYQFPEEHVLHMAIATSMTTILFTAISSVRAQQKKKMIRWDIVLALAPGIIFGGIVGGGKIFSALQGPWLTVFFASFQYFSAYQMLANKKPQATRTLPGKAGLFGTGSLIGVVSSLVGAGGAFISVPFMMWCNVPIHNALATSSALGFPIALASAVGYIIGGLQIEDLPPHSLGYIYLPAVVCISATSVLTASIGVKLAHQLNTTQLRKMFALVLICIATYMLCKNVFKII
jgi:uncharacterized protein